MANRPVFEVMECSPFVKKSNVEFVFCPGFSLGQKKKSMQNLQSAWKSKNAGKEILEVSRASDELLGCQLSAFNLMMPLKSGKSCSVECAFQGAKKFENGGPYTDLLEKTSVEAKKDLRLKESGPLTGFSLLGMDFPLNPPTYFYDWLYVNALKMHPEYHDELIRYSAFTDIMFNPEKQINCQAEAVAIFVGLVRGNKINAATKDRKAFLEIVFGI